MRRTSECSRGANNTSSDLTCILCDHSSTGPWHSRWWMPMHVARDSTVTTKAQNTLGIDVHVMWLKDPLWHLILRSRASCWMDYFENQNLLCTGFSLVTSVKIGDIGLSIASPSCRVAQVRHIRKTSGTRSDFGGPIGLSNMPHLPLSSVEKMPSRREISLFPYRTLHRSYEARCVDGGGSSSTRTDWLW